MIRRVTYEIRPERSLQDLLASLEKDQYRDQMKGPELCSRVYALHAGLEPELSKAEQ